MKHTAFRLVVAVIALFSFVVASNAEEITIADNGEAKLKIVVHAEADETVWRAARDLAHALERISGAEFEVRTGEGAAGIVLGEPKDFPNLPFPTRFGGGPFERDHYRIVSGQDGLYLLGASSDAVEFAVWDLLNQFGYRFYFPSKTWEVVPATPRLTIDIDREEKPDFYNRSAPRGGLRRTLRPWAITEWEQWQVRNRTRSSFVLSTGHAYDGILSRNREEFERHPEFLG